MPHLFVVKKVGSAPPRSHQLIRPERTLEPLFRTCDAVSLIQFPRYDSKMSTLGAIAPFFIINNLRATLEFYTSKLGFTVTYTGGGDGNKDADFFGMVERDRVMIMLKAITPEIHPQPNHTRHEWARWDAYIYTPDPDSLYAEFVEHGVPMHRPLSDTGDGLRAFEITDNNGYVICFGRPIKD